MQLDDPLPSDPPNDTSFRPYQGKDLSPVRREKVNQIIDACRESGSPQRLIALATSSGGLINDDLRRIACRLTARHQVPLS